MTEGLAVQDEVFTLLDGIVNVKVALREQVLVKVERFEVEKHSAERFHGKGVTLKRGDGFWDGSFTLFVGKDGGEETECIFSGVKFLAVPKRLPGGGRGEDISKESGGCDRQVALLRALAFTAQLVKMNIPWHE